MHPRLAHTQATYLREHRHTFDTLTSPQVSTPSSSIGKYWRWEDLGMRLFLCDMSAVGKGSAMSTLLLWIYQYAPFVQKNSLASIITQSLKNVYFVATTSMFWICTLLLTAWTLAHQRVLSSFPRILFLICTYISCYAASTSTNSIYVCSFFTQDSVSNLYLHFLLCSYCLHQLYICMFFFFLPKRDWIQQRWKKTMK